MRKVTHPLLEQAQQQGTPIIDGERATFVWQGHEPAPLLVGDFNHWGYQGTAVRLDQIALGVWAHTLTLRPDAYIEYAYLVETGKEARLPDPFNPRTIWNGVGDFNHFFHMPQAPRENPDARRKPNIARGTVTRLRLEHPGLLVGGKRALRLYRPPVDEPTPLLIVLDGADYFNRAAIVPIVDNLIAERRIRPIALALVENSPSGRFIEYAASEATLALLLDVVLPFAAEHLPLIDARVEPGIHGVLGASMGGLMALYAGLRAPHVFGRIASQSGAFRIHPERPFVIYDLARCLPAPALRLWLDCGLYERLLDGNREMAALLAGRGSSFTYHEYSGGHNYTCWSMVLPRALTTIYGE